MEYIEVKGLERFILVSNLGNCAKFTFLAMSF